MSNKQYNGPTYSGPIDQSPTTPVNNLPTINVVRSGTVSAAGIAVVNIIGGFNVVINATTLVNTQSLLLLATGGIPATVSLSNGGTVSGQQQYVLKPGNVLSVGFDGTNLS